MALQAYASLKQGSGGRGIIDADCRKGGSGPKKLKYPVPASIPMFEQVATIGPALASIHKLQDFPKAGLSTRSEMLRGNAIPARKIPRFSIHCPPIRVGLVEACLVPISPHNHKEVHRIVFPSELVRQKRDFTSHTLRPRTLQPWVDPLLSALKTGGTGCKDRDHTVLVTADYEVTVYFREHFEKLRKSQGLDSDYDFVNYLATATPLSGPRGGLSSANLTTTVDNRFFIKEESRDRFCKSFATFGHRYFDYICNNESCLAKVLGIYKIQTSERATAIIVTDGLTPPKNIGTTVAQYDLKGFPQENVPIADWSFTRPIVIDAASHEKFFEMVERDTKFLEDSSLLDYSLLVSQLDTGFLVVGIIDYLGMTLKRESLLFQVHRSRLLKALRSYFPRKSL